MTQFGVMPTGDLAHAGIPPRRNILTNIIRADEERERNKRAKFEHARLLAQRAREEARRQEIEWRRRKVCLKGLARAGIVSIKPASMLEIIAATAREYGFSLQEIIGPGRGAGLCIARHEAMWRCRSWTGKSYPQIGRVFHRDHSSCIHGVRRHEARMKQLQPPADAVE